MLAICIATKHIQLGATARFTTAQHLANHLASTRTSSRSTPDRSATYLGGVRVPIRTPVEAVEFSFADVAHPDVVISYLHACDERDRGAIE